MMPENPNQPREYDAVLGGQAPPPVSGVVLGGIEGVKRRLDSTHSQEIRIAALSDALKYGKEGQELLNQIVLTETGVLQSVAYDLLFDSSTEDEKQNLLQHIPLQSEAGVDYSNLHHLLASRKLLQANLETVEKILEAVGKESQLNLHNTDLDNLSQTDLRTINQLWVKFSNNRFGFSVQKRILLAEGYNFHEKKDRIANIHKPYPGGSIVETYTQLGWLPSEFEKSQFTFETAPIGSLPMLNGKVGRGGWFIQITLMYRSDS